MKRMSEVVEIVKIFFALWGILIIGTILVGLIHVETVQTPEDQAKQAILESSRRIPSDRVFGTIFVPLLDIPEMGDRRIVVKNIDTADYYEVRIKCCCREVLRIPHLSVGKTVTVTYEEGHYAFHAKSISQDGKPCEAHVTIKSWSSEDRRMR
jgi:hypothetical protein